MDINRNNYETYFLLYLDRELNPSEMSEVEKFVTENADLQKEFSLLRQTILVPVQTVFDQKELLFRKEDRRRVIPIYWTRIAAAVAVLVLGGWLMTSQLVRKQGDGISGADSKKNVVAVQKNSYGQKTQDAHSNMTDKSDTEINNIHPAVQENITRAKNQSAGNNARIKSSVKPVNELSGKNNPVEPLASVRADQHSPSSGEVSDELDLAMHKSSAQELQPVNSESGTDPKHVSALPGDHSPVLLIAAAGTAESVPDLRDDHAAFVENENQTDNAISVVALNDKNKGITRLFKKLTSRTPTDVNARKVRVSVFQFSY